MASPTQTICLTMIVKNEAHLIEQTLKHLCERLPITTWAISDTGSTDGTQDIIRRFFAAKGLSGLLTEDSWRDFGYNRTRAFEHAQTLGADYMFVWDADDFIEGTVTLPTPLNADAYLFTFGNAQGFRYSRLQLFSCRRRWKYVGVLHEYPTSADDTPYIQQVVSGPYYFVSGRAGSRNKDPNKYLNDAIILERALRSDEPTNSRYAFYCANSYRNANEREKAIAMYKETLTMNGWVQEKYMSCVYIADVYRDSGKEDEGLHWLVAAHKYAPERVEHIYRLVKYYCVKDMDNVALAYYSLVRPLMEGGRAHEGVASHLFAAQEEYAFFLPYYVVIAGTRMGSVDAQIAAAAAFRVACKARYMHAGDWWVGNLFHNLQFVKLPANLETLFDMLAWRSSLTDAGSKAFGTAQNKAIADYVELCRPLLVARSAAVAEQLAPRVTTKANASPRVLLTMTTCKRRDLFAQTMNSLLHTWTDVSAIDSWFFVDDGSSEEDRAWMRAEYPWVSWCMKTEAQKGHRASMNIIWNHLQETRPTYWIHLEDDWLFMQRDAYVTWSIAALEKHENANIHQVLFNRNYAELYTDWDIEGGRLLEPGLRVHVQGAACTGRNNAYWPHYSFRPSMIRVSTVLALGNYDSPNTFFERDYADRWFSAGYQSAFWDTITCKHVGKLTSDRMGTNAYTLNATAQFGETGRFQTKSFIVNLARRPDRRETVLREFAKVGHVCSVFEAIDGKALVPTEEIRRLFRLNDFGSWRGVIGCALSHRALWLRLASDSDADAYWIFEDDITLTSSFKEQFANANQSLQTHGALLLGYHSRESATNLKPGTHTLQLQDYIGGTFGYGVTKQTAQKLLDHCASYGIRHGIDYQMVRAPGITWNCVLPHCVTSEWVSSTKPTVDSDIQRDTDALLVANPTEWEFVLHRDSHGHDIEFVGRHTIHELMRIAECTPGCVAFNTLGFLKHTVASVLKPSNYFGVNDGVYLRRQGTRKTRILMLCNWCSSEQLCKEWNKMTQGDYTWNNLRMVWSEPADYYVIINRPPAGASYDPARTIVFQMEPWCSDPAQNWGVKTWGIWARPDPAKFLAVRTHERDYNNGFWQIPQTYTELIHMNPHKTQGNRISSICSSKYFDPGHIKRIDFLKFIEAKADPAVQLHIYNEDNNHGFQSYMGKARPDIDKDKGINPYKYYFMCENNEERNFITEKLWEPLLTDTLCFYWGCPNVADWIDPRAFVWLDMNDFETAFATVKQAIQEDWWSQRLPYIRAEKQRVLHYFAFMPTVERTLHAHTIRQRCVDTATDVCFIHSCHLATAGTTVLDTLLDAVKSVPRVYIVNIGQPLPASYTYERVTVIEYSARTDLFELPTLRLLHSYAQANPGKRVLYLHTKGISYAGKADAAACSMDWTRFMLYGLTSHVDACRTLLTTGTDVIGCNYATEPRAHYSGNFWWATTEHIASLAVDALVDKMSAEWWILSKPCRRFDVHASSINHFMERYLPSMYETAVQQRFQAISSAQVEG